MTTFIPTRWLVNTYPYGVDADRLFGVDGDGARDYADTWSLTAEPYWSN